MIFVRKRTLFLLQRHTSLREPEKERPFPSTGGLLWAASLGTLRGERDPAGKGAS